MKGYKNVGLARQPSMSIKSNREKKRWSHQHGRKSTRQSGNGLFHSPAMPSKEAQYGKNSFKN